MAGYSSTPLPKKLGIRLGDRVALLRAPKGFAAALSGLPEDVRVANALRGKARCDVIVLFAGNRRALAAALPRAVEALTVAGGLWIAWPKQSSGVATDLSETFVREAGLATGLVDNKVCAIDDTWSGLRFVRRLASRLDSARLQSIHP